MLNLKNKKTPNIKSIQQKFINLETLFTVNKHKGNKLK